MTSAFITGITGQDGALLARHLISQGYRVGGLVLPQELESPPGILAIMDQLSLYGGDLQDKKNLEAALMDFKPDEVYNLGGVSAVGASWEDPLLTTETVALGPMRILDIIKRRLPHTRFLQASSSEIFGNPRVSPQDETAPISPRNPYGWAKAVAHEAVKTYRERHGLFACNAILYNHESTSRPLDFVTRKITHTAAQIKLGLASELCLGDTSAVRDWGWAEDYVRAFPLMLSQARPDDFVLATGQGHTVAEFCERAFACLEMDYCERLITDPGLIRPGEDLPLIGCPGKAERILGWRPRFSFDEIVKTMVQYDLNLLKEMV